MFQFDFSNRWPYLVFWGCQFLPWPGAFLAVILHGAGGAASVVAARILFLALVAASCTIPGPMVIAFDRRTKSRLISLLLLFVVWGCVQLLMPQLCACFVPLLFRDDFLMHEAASGSTTCAARDA
jgi:hypothetical protein